MKAQPQQEHQWLAKLVGDWTCEGEAAMEPGKPPEKWQATESVRSLGGLWFLCEGQGEMPGGGTSTSVMTLGYDPDRQRFTGSFIASVMTHMWIYDGKLDAERRELTLDTEGPSMAGDSRMARYQDIITFISDDHRTLTSRALGEDGQWTQFMTAHYRRK
jgi:hypothetical protein